MNIIYIHTHDSGRYLQPYGHNIPTPNLMTMAREGVLFRQCYNSSPTCCPSRASMLTGMNPHSSGMLGLAHRGFALNDSSQHLASYLRRNGYETVLCGVQHETRKDRPHELGYERILSQVDAPLAPGTTSPEQDESKMNVDRANARRVAEFLREPKSRPFFLSFGMNCTHRPFPTTIDPDINPDYVQPPRAMPDTPETRRDTAAFITLARCEDECVGVVLDALKQSGLDDDTFVFFTTDHGIAFPKMKCTLYDDGIGVALIVKFPRGAHRGKTIDVLVSHLDIFPTLCDIANLEKPSWLEGHSLLPLVRGETNRVRDEIFAEVTYHAAYEPMRCIRTPRYKYIRYFDDFNRVVKPNIDDGASKQFLLATGLIEMRHDDAEMLFDLYFDPSERNNLANDSAYATVKQELATRLHQYMHETHDPLLQGYVPKPQGARVNRKTGLHPYEEDYE